MSLSEAQKHHAVDIGLGTISNYELLYQEAKMVKAIDLGIHRLHTPQVNAAGYPQDEGLPVQRTGFSPLSFEKWESVQPGTEGITCQIHPRIWSYEHVRKGKDGGLEMINRYFQTYTAPDQKTPSYEEFLSRIANALRFGIGDFNRNELLLGVILDFPHTSYRHGLDVDAAFTPTKDGDLPGGWKIRDWSSVKDQNPSLAADLRQILRKSKINLAHGMFVDSAFALASDVVTFQKTKKTGDEVIPGVLFGGNATQAYLIDTDLVRLNINSFPWLKSAIFDQMVDQKLAEGSPQLEHETGRYIPVRSAIASEMLGIENTQLGTAAYIEQTERFETTTPWGINRLLGESFLPSKESSELMQLALERSSQVYGIAAAALANIVHGTRTPKSAELALISDGRILLEAGNLKEQTENVARYLEQPIKLIEGSQYDGIAYLTLSQYIHS